MGRAQTVITKDIYNKAKLALKEVNSSSRVSIRLKSIVSAYDNGITLTGKILKVSPSVLRIWARRFDTEGIRGLKYRDGRGRKGNIPKSKYSTIREWVTADSSITLKEIVIRLKEVFSINTSITVMHGILVKLGLAYITPRPVHYKQNKKDQNDFKK